ncbi:MAG: sulfite exporter TauE/SafE family protein [Bdellovibrionales bacterium]|nr:sulfite exporter TauE/SafE family protein [Bdellovibrionales bacterium]
MERHDIALTLIAFAAEFVGTLSGFGSSTFFVPAALLIESAQFVLVLTGILHCFGNLWKLILFREKFPWRTFFFLAVPAVISTGVGAWLASAYVTTIFRPVLGAFLIFVGLFSLFMKSRALRASRSVALLLSVLSGVATGLVGTGGALRGLALTTLQVPKLSFVALSSAIDIGGDILRTAIYLQSGFMNWEEWYYIPMLGIGAYLGARLGRYVLTRLEQHHFERIVAFFVIVSGIALL